MPREDRRRSRTRSRSRRRRTPSRDAKKSRREQRDGGRFDDPKVPTRDARRDDRGRDEREPERQPEQQKKPASSKFQDFDIGSLMAPPPPPPPPPPPFEMAQFGGGMPTVRMTIPISGDMTLEEQQSREAAQDPSVASFVPMLPKSMLQLVLPSAGASGGQSMQLTVPVAPLVSAEFVKLARECRRCHVSGFPHTTTKRDLEVYFTAVCQDVRKKMIQRQTGKEVRDSVIVDIDRVLDVFLDVTKNHPFGFVEMNFEDMSAELVAQSEEDMFNFLASDGRSYPLRIRRPKDFKNLTSVEPTKMVMIGVPSISESSIRDKVLAQYGAVKNFQMVDNMVYCEFDEREPVDMCVDELNGFVLANRLIVVRALSDCLRATCFTAGVKMSPPIQTQEEAAPPAVVERDLCKEAMDLITPLHKVLGGVSTIFSHLKPLFGSAVPVFPTCILVLLNAIDEQELVLDEDYSSLLAALSEELEKYGRIKRLLVPRRTPMPTPPKPFVAKKVERTSREVDLLSLKNPFERATAGQEDVAEVIVDDAEYRQEVAEQEAAAAEHEAAKDEYRRLRDEWDAEIRHPVHGGYGRVFAEFESVDEAAFAQRSICGKLFSGRTVITSFMFEDVLYPPPEDDEADPAHEDLAAERAEDQIAPADSNQHQMDQQDGAGDID